MYNSLKEKLLAIEKTSEFISIVGKEFGYTEKVKRAGNHATFTARGMQNLSIPRDKRLSPGTRRQIVKSIFGEDYYNA